MPLALAIGLWMAPPGTKLTPTAPDTGCPGLARPDLTHAYTPSAMVWLLLSCPCSPHLWLLCGFLAPTQLFSWASLVAQMVNNLPAMWENQI